MSSKFDELINQLKKLQGGQGAPMRKALPPVPLPAPRLPNMRRLAGRLDMMTKSLATQNADRARRAVDEKRETFLKSMGTINDQITAGIAAGTISGHEACILQSRLHALGDRAHAMLAARGQL